MVLGAPGTGSARGAGTAPIPPRARPGDDGNCRRSVRLWRLLWLSRGMALTLAIYGDNGRAHFETHHRGRNGSDLIGWTSLVVAKPGRQRQVVRYPDRMQRVALLT